VKGTDVKFAFETLREAILALEIQPGTVFDEASLAKRVS
jgi:DNA-binding GntR family transcriptional regulator